MIYAIMDIGSNTVRLSVYKQNEDKAIHLFSEKEQASLRNYVKKGNLTDKGIDRLIATLRRFNSIISNFDDIDSVHPFATATIRDVANRSEILKRVKDELGLDIEILSGEDEARLSFIGASKSVDVSEGVLTDIGGGSSEVVIIDQGKVIKSTSLSIGSLSAFNDYVTGLFTNKKEKKAIDNAVKLLLAENKMYREKQNNLAAVGGSARASLKFYNEYYNLSNYNSTMDAKKFNKMVKEILEMDDRDILDRILEIKPDRVHTLIPGMVILNRLAKYFYVNEINISQTGVREGYVYSKLLERK
ncbi:Exopolyphosphatase [Anaerococcus prevotii]|uniref:Ppx/GppA phosphatase n=1 Tax=Anaerococcus prevotii (strain ATCC 9321 / DSM 20548 / JCM 6508 / NCTC 11806 / PC1) TaxID=525919 RepID=C7RGC9_ANAPD|nr:exopolyphosphatase [Anaerococcus prevotii]ACV28540.1 Ppx/GppA phosphatase [Anaerococcus prevotii DSM 20548]SUU94099.1 Exopolyphosphatase [Anaerococcus prevotii]